jgi:hypothetical protein
MLSIPSAEAQQVTDRTAVTHALVSIGAASAVALAANDNRNFLMLQNTHATQTIDCKFGATAVAGEGFRVAPAFAVAVRFDVKVPVGVLNCIASGGATGLNVTEGSR